MSSISSVANGGQNSATQQVQANIGLLAANLASNNLSGARRAFSGLQQALGTPAAATPLGKDLSSLGQALKSGDLTNARQIFSRLGRSNASANANTPAPAAGPQTYNPIVSGSGSALDIAV